MVWVRRSFGRVLPHVAGHHHTLSLERKVFTAWREVWWDSRREWKLVIRADCHNRFACWGDSGCDSAHCHAQVSVVADCVESLVSVRQSWEGEEKEEEYSARSW